METFRKNIDKELARCEEIEHSIQQIIQQITHDYNICIDRGQSMASLTVALPGGGMLDIKAPVTDSQTIEVVMNAVIGYYRNKINDIKETIDIAFDEYLRKY